MTVHMIRVVASTNGMSLSEINAAMDDWMSKQSEWTEDLTEHTITVDNTGVDGEGTDYYDGTYRLTFDSEPKDNLLQKCGDKLKDKVDWYRIGYHECGHDRDDLSIEYDCVWSSDDEREWTDKDVTIPSGVPKFQ